jgi:hypothetical protein
MWRASPGTEPTAGEAAVDETAAQTTRRCAHEMMLRSAEISAEISAQILANVAGLTPNGSAQAVKALRESTEQSVGSIFAALAFGVPADAAEPPSGTQELLRHTVAEGGEITALLRAYRYGHALLWEMWSDHVAHCVTDAARLRDVLSTSSKHIFTYIDRSCERLAHCRDLGCHPLKPSDKSSWTTHRWMRPRFPRHCSATSGDTTSH